LRSLRFVTTGLVGFAALLIVGSAEAAPTVEDYRDFRALSIDLLGRAPTTAEIAEMEKPGFDRTAWIDKHLGEPQYAERVARVYLDLLRLELPTVVQFQRPSVNLQRIDLLVEGGKRVPVYYRFGQRRTTPAVERRFCLTDAETGLKITKNQIDATTEVAVPLALLSARAKKVKPWWLYRDYKKGAAAVDRYDPLKWSQPGVSSFRIIPALDKEPDGTAATDVWVCNEEAGEAATGHLTGTDEYSKAHKNEPIACTSANAFLRASDCGCGPGLERCLPGSRNAPEPTAFEYPTEVALGVDLPLAIRPAGSGVAARLWWAEEARRYMQTLFGQDRDMRDLLRGKSSMVNGPLAQFYRYQADSTCCGDGIYFGQKESDPLFDPKSVPDLNPTDIATWKEVPDRGPLASGILTMPVFLTKYGTRRARAHALYNAFLCKEFIAPPGLALPPSNEQNLMKRAGCAACHATLEPMSTYFTRVKESDWTFLSPSQFPTTLAACKKNADGLLGTPGNTGLNPNRCAQYYDPAFSTASEGVLRGSQPDILAPNGTSRADAGPRGLADNIIGDPEFASCVAKNVASSFLGRSLDADDEGLKKMLTDALTSNGFHMRAVVRTLLVSDTYKKANNLTSAAWRKEVAR
jgi:hypothetical protein